MRLGVRLLVHGLLHAALILLAIFHLRHAGLLGLLHTALILHAGLAHAIVHLSIGLLRLISLAEAGLIHLAALHHLRHGRRSGNGAAAAHVAAAEAAATILVHGHVEAHVLIGGSGVILLDQRGAAQVARVVGCPAAGEAARPVAVGAGLFLGILLLGEGGLFKAGSNDGDAHLVVHILVDAGAEDDVGLAVGGLHDQVGGLVDVDDAHVLAAGNINQHRARAVDVGFKQRALDGVLGSLHHAVFTLAGADAHMGQAAGLHDGLDVSEVQIDKGRHGDQVADALDALAQHVVGDAEGLQHGGALRDHLKQTVVGDHDQRIHALLEVDHAHLGVLHALLALKSKGLGDHRDGQAVEIAGDFRHDGGCARAGSAAHAGRNKNQIRALERLRNFLAAFFRRAAAHIRHCACAQALGQLFANLDGRAGLAHGKGLTVCIDGDEFHALEACVHHTVDGIVAGAAAADYLDARKALLILDLKLKHSASPYSIFLRSRPGRQPPSKLLKKSLMPPATPLEVAFRASMVSMIRSIRPMALA